jgi:hypothetical protein
MDKGATAAVVGTGVATVAAVGATTVAGAVAGGGAIGAVLATGLVVAGPAMPAVAALAGIYALGRALRSKDKKYAEAISKADSYERKYRGCHKKNKAAGKPYYPEKPGKGPFYTDCRGDYKKWKHWEERAAKLAIDLKAKLGRSGKLDKQTAKELDAAIARPKALAAVEKHVVSGTRSAEGLPPLTEEELMITEEDAALVPEGPNWMLIGGGVVGTVVLVGGAYYMLRK